MPDKKNNIESSTPKPETMVESAEKPINTPEQVAEFTETTIKRVDSNATEMVNAGTEAIDSAVESIGGDNNDRVEGEGRLHPIQEEIEKAKAEAEQEIELASLEVMSDSWRSSAIEALNKNNLIPDPETAPYKAFNEEGLERFFIQKCKDQAGNEVVVKISSPIESSKRQLEREGKLYDLLKGSRELGSEGISIRFPEKIGQIEYGEQLGIITDYIEDDTEKKDNLDGAQKVELISRILREMQKLPIPQEEIDKPHNERIAPIMTASEYRWQFQQNKIPSLLESGIISKEEAESLSKMIEENEELIASFPLKFEHGDLHGGNIFYSENENGESQVSLIDLESLQVSNEFSPLAQITNRNELLRRLREYSKKSDNLEGVRHLIEKQFKMLDDEELVEKIEEQFVSGHERSEDAERVYRIMRISDILGNLQRLGGSKEKYAEGAREIFRGILDDQMSKLK